MSILADWYRKMMGTDRSTMIAKDNVAHGEWADPEHFSPAMQAKIDRTRQRIAVSTAVHRAHVSAVATEAASNYADMCRQRTKGWPQWKINFNLTAEERSRRTSRGNVTRYAAMREGR